MRLTPIATAVGLCLVLVACNSSEPSSTSVPAMAAASSAQEVAPVAAAQASPAPVQESNPAQGDASGTDSQTRYFDCNGAMVSETLSNGGNNAAVEMNGASYAMKRAESNGSSRYTDAKGNALVHKGKTETTLIMSGEKDIVCKEEFKKS